MSLLHTLPNGKSSVTSNLLRALCPLPELYPSGITQIDGIVSAAIRTVMLEKAYSKAATQLAGIRGSDLQRQVDRLEKIWDKLVRARKDLKLAVTRLNTRLEHNNA